MKTPVSLLSHPPIPGRASAARQRGVVLFFALIVLVILLIGGIVVVRSINASLYGAGNLAFRRDLTNQSDLAVAKVIQTLSTAGGSCTAADCIPDLKTTRKQANYSAVTLPADRQGVPLALLDGSFGNAPAVPGTTGGVTISYIIERMCDSGSEGQAATAARCVLEQANAGGSGGTSCSAGRCPPLKNSVTVVYRLSTRVDGPRNTQAFFQTLLTGPG